MEGERVNMRGRETGGKTERGRKEEGKKWRVG